MRVIAYDPYVDINTLEEGVEISTWPQKLDEVDFVVVNCALTPSSRHLLNTEALL